MSNKKIFSNLFNSYVDISYSIILIHRYLFYYMKANSFRIITKLKKLFFARN